MFLVEISTRRATISFVQTRNYYPQTKKIKYTLSGTLEMFYKKKIVTEDLHDFYEYGLTVRLRYCIKLLTGLTNYFFYTN